MVQYLRYGFLTDHLAQQCKLALGQFKKDKLLLGLKGERGKTKTFNILVFYFIYLTYQSKSGGG